MEFGDTDAIDTDSVNTRILRVVYISSVPTCNFQTRWISICFRHLYGAAAGVYIMRERREHDVRMSLLSECLVIRFRWNTSAWYRLPRRILYIFWQARIYRKHLDKLEDLHDISLSGGGLMRECSFYRCPILSLYIIDIIVYITKILFNHTSLACSNIVKGNMDLYSERAFTMSACI